jgi:hypothetical protein
MKMVNTLKLTTDNKEAMTDPGEKKGKILFFAGAR